MSSEDVVAEHLGVQMCTSASRTRTAHLLSSSGCLIERSTVGELQCANASCVIHTIYAASTLGLLGYTIIDCICTVHLDRRECFLDHTH